MVGGDWNNTRYSTLALINTRNVKQLRGAWVFTFDEGGISRVTPVVKDGLMFVTGGRKVYTLNAKTGEIVWTYKTVPDALSVNISTTKKSTEALSSPDAAPNATGVAVGRGMVFVGLQDGHVIALTAKTGEPVWFQQTGINEPKKGQTVTAAPTYIDGVVFAGLSNGDWHLRGRLTALDAPSGNVLWQLFSIPGPGEPGHKTWPSFNDVWKLGGGGVWTSSPVDPELGTVYATTGNPMPPFAGHLRPGNNLYTDSVLAVDMKSGRLKWYYQLVHHDVFEADAGTPVILYNWKHRKALAVMRADGYLFQLDRETGKPLLPVKERRVPQLASQSTSPTQPFPVAGESILMSCEDWRKESIPQGFVLGCMWTPPASPPPSKDPQNVLAPFPAVRRAAMAYSPQTGYFYAQGTSMLNWPRRAHDPYFLDWSGTVPGLNAYGELAAIDSRTGKIAWKKRIPAWRHGGLPAALYRHGGLIVTAGGLMFRSSGDGNVEAYDAWNGDVLWQFQTGMSGTTGSPATYEIDGEQYIAVPVGSSLWTFKLRGEIPAAATSLASTEDDDFSTVIADGAVVETDKIETTSLHRSPFGVGMHYFIDEFAFNPYRARVTRGTKVLFVNNGTMRHEFLALDGSWNTGPLSPAQEAWMSFDKPGKYSYICKNHPWVYGQILVEEAAATTHAMSSSKNVQSNLSRFAEQAMRGKELFNKNCSTCHGDDLGGRATAPALSGTAFKARWKNATIRDLFDRIWTTMPQSSPGNLDQQTYLDIVAYLLRANDVPFGTSEINANSEALHKTKVGQINLD